jgi:hypothetical protein
MDEKIPLDKGSYFQEDSNNGLPWTRAAMPPLAPLILRLRSSLNKPSTSENEVSVHKIL